MGDLTDLRVDRERFSRGRLADPSEDKHYWLSRSHEDRLVALEIMRQIMYGYDPATTRLQRFLETAQRAPR